MDDCRGNSIKINKDFRLNGNSLYNTPFFELDFPNSHSFLALHYKRKGGFPVTYRFTNVPVVF